MTTLIRLVLAVCLYLTVCNSLSANSKVELLKQLEKVAGVYKNESRSNGLKLEKTVLITGCNHGFINHLLNFKCFADRLGFKFLVIAMDERAHQYITANTTMDSYLMTGGAVGEVTGHSTEFRSRQFNLITARKKEAVHDILKLGYDVVFSDTDVAMVRDPLPYMLRTNVDYVHSLNYMCTVGETWDFHKSKIEGNTGFYFVRSNNNTIKLWADAFAAAPKFPRLDDQAIFWRVIRESDDPPVLPIGRCRHYNSANDLASMYQYRTHKRFLISCMLDTCAFSSGMISRVYEPELTYETLMANLKTLNESLVTLHANYLSGNRKKMLRMKEYGFWLSHTDENGQHVCAVYKPHALPTASAATTATTAPAK